MLGRLFSRLRHLVGSARSRRELDEEIAFHLERLMDDLVRGGMDPEAARREAIHRFGSPERVHARVREERGLALLDETARHLRLALRGAVRSPLFSGTFVAVLALCVGLGTAAFAVADAVLWRPFPYPDPDRLAFADLYDPDLGKTRGNVAVDGRTWERIRDAGEPFQRAVYSDWVRGVNLVASGEAAFVRQQRVGAGYFEALGVRPHLGREFVEAEDVPGGPAAAILSHALWTRTFGADPGVLGRQIRLKGEEHTVVGVMDPGFRSSAGADVWTPLRATTTGEGSGTNYRVLVRVPSGMGFAEADARFGAIEPPPSKGGRPRRFGLVPYADALTAGVRLPVVVLLAAAGLMLAVGCANLAGLRVARALARRAEMATRRALGGGRGALVRGTVAEDAVLGLFGAAGGIGVAWLATSALGGLVRTHFGVWQDVRLDGRALAVAVALAALATVLAGLAPALRAWEPGAHRVLAGGTRVVGAGGHALRKTLVAGQVALVTALLFAAALLVRGHGHLEGLDPGFETEGALAVQLSLDDARYGEAGAVRDLFRESLDRIERIPGVASAAVSLTLPYERPLNLSFQLPGDDRWRVTNAVYVTPGFFETLDIPLLRGRTFEEGDREGAPYVAVANAAWVEANVPAGPALGARVDMGFFQGEGGTVVGVAGNVQQSAGWGDTTRPVWETPTLYLPVAQANGAFFRQVHVWFTPSWTVRTARPPLELAPEVVRAFREVDPDLPVARAAPLTDVVGEAFARQRLEAAFVVAAAAFALLLAGVGLWGIVAHEALERRAEMGLRMALGSTPAGAVRSAAAGGLRPTVLGLAAGALASVAVARVLERLVWDVAPYDPAALLALLGVLALVAGTASVAPALRVARVDPAAILRDR